MRVGKDFVYRDVRRVALLWLIVVDVVLKKYSVVNVVTSVDTLSRRCSTDKTMKNSNKTHSQKPKQVLSHPDDIRMSRSDYEKKIAAYNMNEITAASQLMPYSTPRSHKIRSASDLTITNLHQRGLDQRRPQTTPVAFDRPFDLSMVPYLSDLPFVSDIQHSSQGAIPSLLVDSDISDRPLVPAGSAEFCNVPGFDGHMNHGGSEFPCTCC